jgi:hypothetical protein
MHAGLWTVPPGINSMLLKHSNKLDGDGLSS